MADVPLRNYSLTKPNPKPKDTEI